MTTTPEDLRTFIRGTTSITSLVDTRVHYNQLPQESSKPHVWFRITSDTEELTMDGVGGIHEAFADIECVGLTEATAQAVAAVVKPRLHGYKGTFGNKSAKAMFLSDKDDDYEPFSNQSAEGVHVVSYGLRFWYST